MVFDLKEEIILGRDFSKDEKKNDRKISLNSEKIFLEKKLFNISSHFSFLRKIISKSDFTKTSDKMKALLSLFKKCELFDL